MQTENSFLTGRWYHQRTWFGLVLYVEWCQVRYNGPEGKYERYDFKKARPEDLITLKIH